MRQALLCLLALLWTRMTLGDDLESGRNYLHSTLNRIQIDRMEPKEESDNFINDDYGYNNIVFSDDDKWDTMNVTGTQPAQNAHEGYQIYSPDAKPDIPVEDLINLIFSPLNKEEPVREETNGNPYPSLQDAEMKPEIENGASQKPSGYYYYFYPLKNLESLKDHESYSDLPAELAQVLKMIKPMMPMMPTMPTKMTTPKTPVGPLFASMLWFVGTALVFIVSILLMPRVKIVKVKSLPEGFDNGLDKIDDKFNKIIQNLRK
ncbi:uncharacterized protein LOC106661262 [Cimex lectularius]|uniref:Uncharacterized protein n=1 Tax=Cimex lectularius TaxID=79782 RepID=A0A8I6SRH0_CIMLE|nr:uncharacterized protein LOC106661262 [Cimex lectularius]